MLKWEPNAFILGLDLFFHFALAKSDLKADV